MTRYCSSPRSRRSRGLENVDAIAAVPGIDVLWIGHHDLTNSMGIPGQFDHPRYVEAVQRVLDAANRNGKAAGFMAPTIEIGKVLLRQGFRILAYSGDLWIYQQALREGLRRYDPTPRMGFAGGRPECPRSFHCQLAAQNRLPRRRITLQVAVKMKQQRRGLVRAKWLAGRIKAVGVHGLLAAELDVRGRHSAARTTAAIRRARTPCPGAALLTNSSSHLPFFGSDGGRLP